jgi:hypothetical protein
VAPLDLFGGAVLWGLASGACVTSTLSAFSQSSIKNGSIVGGSILAYPLFQFRSGGTSMPATGQAATACMLRSIAMEGYFAELGNSGL